jgi:hypothetical protein
MPKAWPSISIKAQVAVYAINERSETLLKYLPISSLYLNGHKNINCKQLHYILQMIPGEQKTYGYETI